MVFVLKPVNARAGGGGPNDGGSVVAGSGVVVVVVGGTVLVVEGGHQVTFCEPWWTNSAYQTPKFHRVPKNAKRPPITRGPLELSSAY